MFSFVDLIQIYWKRSLGTVVGGRAWMLNWKEQKEGETAFQIQPEDSLLMDSVRFTSIKALLLELEVTLPGKKTKQKNISQPKHDILRFWKKNC